MSYINGDLYFAHIKEVEGGKYFALEKPNDSNLLCIVISSTWRWHAAILAVAESSEDVTKFSLNYYNDLMQFTGYRDRATRCAQVLRLLLIDRVGVDPSNPLVVIQLDITGTNTICSIERQLQLDVLARKASRTCGGSRCSTWWCSHAPLPLTNTGILFSLCQGWHPSCVSVTIKITHTICHAQRGGQQGDRFETVRFGVTAHLCFGQVYARHPICQGHGIYDDVVVMDLLDQV